MAQGKKLGVNNNTDEQQKLIETLSNEARAILATLWLTPGFVMTIDFAESELTDIARKGLDELIEADIISRTIPFDGDTARQYRLTDAGRKIDRRPPGRKHKDKLKFLDKYGSFSIVQPKEG